MNKNVKKYLLNREKFKIYFVQFDFEMLNKILALENHDELSNDNVFIVEILKCALQKFRFEREASIKKPSLISDKSEMHIYLYLLIKSFKDYGNLVLEEAKKCINSKDEWVVSVGFEILSDENNENVVDEKVYLILENMKKSGISELPYRQGAILAEYLKKDYKLFDQILENVNEENENFIQAILKTFSIMNQLPIEAEAFILSTLKSRQCESKNIAVIAAGSCKILRQEAVSLLREELMSDHWYIRGNATYSLALLKIKDDNIIDKIIELLNDDEGNDWSVNEKAIEALGLIGKRANNSVCKLLELIEKEFNQNNTEYKIAIICQSLAKIDSGTEKVINTLIEVIKKCQFIAVPTAIKTLAQFREKSKKVLPYLIKYVNQDDYLEEGLEEDISPELLLLESIFKIGGIKEQLLHDYIYKLKISQLEEERKVVQIFLETVSCPDVQT